MNAAKRGAKKCRRHHYRNDDRGIVQSASEQRRCFRGELRSFTCHHSDFSVRHVLRRLLGRGSRCGGIVDNGLLNRFQGRSLKELREVGFAILPSSSNPTTLPTNPQGCGPVFLIGFENYGGEDLEIEFVTFADHFRNATTNHLFLDFVSTRQFVSHSFQFLLHTFHLHFSSLLANFEMFGDDFANFFSQLLLFFLRHVTKFLR